MGLTCRYPLAINAIIIVLILLVIWLGINCYMLKERLVPYAPLNQYARNYQQCLTDIRNWHLINNNNPNYLLNNEDYRLCRMKYGMHGRQYN